MTQADHTHLLGVAYPPTIHNMAGDMLPRCSIRREIIANGRLHSAPTNLACVAHGEAHRPLLDEFSHLKLLSLLHKTREAQDHVPAFL
jgi:hypothetical protein